MYIKLDIYYIYIHPYIYSDVYGARNDAKYAVSCIRAAPLRRLLSKISAVRIVIVSMVN